jgi:hypothetical protein
MNHPAHDAKISWSHRVPGMDIEMQHLYIIPMAIVILSSPIISMLLNLFVLPSFYWTFGKAGTLGSLQQQKARHNGILIFFITAVLLQEAGRFGS